MACVPGGVLRRSRLQLQGWFGRARDLRYLPSDDQQGPSQSAISFPARTPKPLTRSGDIPEHWPTSASSPQRTKKHPRPDVDCERQDSRGLPFQFQIALLRIVFYVAFTGSSVRCGVLRNLFICSIFPPRKGVSSSSPNASATTSTTRSGASWPVRSGCGNQVSLAGVENVTPIR